KTKANSAPLKINSKVKVGNLNADRLDGLDSSALETLTYTFPLSGTTLNTKMTFALPGLRPGIYLATYAVTAQVYGAGGTLVCDFDNGQAEQVINNNFVSGGGRVFVSAAGVLDARTSTYVFECVTDGTHFDVPSPAGPASVHLTRIDKTINTPTTGVGS
ncbi:hypothetical protein, partial [Nocardioides sp.]|uniref:hypothetical protein n=1 Tax=Nocardioides sp. TaxID=35761 RepID=UPI003566742B